MSQPGRGPATPFPPLRLPWDDRVRDIEVPTSPMPCCGCQSDRGKNHDPARTEGPNLIETDIARSLGQDHANARVALARQVLTEAARDVLQWVAGAGKRHFNRTKKLG